MVVSRSIQTRQRKHPSLYVSRPYPTRRHSHRNSILNQKSSHYLKACLSECLILFFLTFVLERLIYAPPDDEYDEDENFQVIGETDPTEQSDSGNSEGVPVRILTDFAIYECATRQLVPIAELIKGNLAVNNKMYRASGYVKSHMDDDEYCDDDCDDEDNGNGMSNDEDCLQRIRLTEIRKFTIHDIRQRPRRLDE